MSKKKTGRIAVDGHLSTPGEMAAYLEARFKEADVDGALIAKALGDIARTKGMTQVARDAGLSRESLYKTLSGERAPGFDTILKVMTALGLKLRAEAATGEPATIEGPGTTVSDRQLGEEELKESGTFLRALIRTIPDLVWLKDPEGKYLLCNSRFEDLYGAEEKEIIGKTDHDFVAKEVADRFRKNDALAIAEGKSIKMDEEVVYSVDGHRETLESVKTPVYGNDGRLIGVLGIGRDISERKRLERENLSNLYFLENMDKVNRIMQAGGDLEQTLLDVLDAVFSIFGCDRAFLIYPCDPESPTWTTVMERANPEFPGAPHPGIAMPMSPFVKTFLQALLCTDYTVEIVSGKEIDPEIEPWKTSKIKSSLARAVYPKVGKPWVVGMHQCSDARVWTPEEKVLFRGISRRLADGLTNLLMYRDLKQNQEFLDNIFENIPDLLFVKDADECRYIRWNRASEALLGYPREEILGKTEYDFLPKEEAEHFLAVDREVLGRNRPVDIPENRVRTRAGEERIFHTRKIPIPDETGKPKYLLAISEDITERRKNEIELIETKERLQSFMDSATDAISIYDSDYRLADINKAALSYLPKNTEKKDLIGKNLADLVSGFAKDNDPEDYRQVLNTGIPFHETKSFTINGIKHWIIVKIFKVGNGLGILSSDITAIKAAEEETSITKEHLQSFMDSATDAMLAWDSKLNLTGINNKALSFFPDGVKKEALLGMNIQDFIGFFENKNIPELFHQVLKTGEPHFSEEMVAFQQNVPRWLNVSVFKVGDGIGVIANDITEKKNLEEQLRQAQKMESIGRLAGGVAHDFNNMLSIIIGHAELAQSCVKPGDPLVENLQEIRKAADRSADLTRQLLAFARKQIVAPKVIDLNETLGRMLKMLRSLIGEHIDLTWRPGMDLWPIRMDPSQVDQIIANLCVNARDAIADVGGIVIETKNTTFDERYCASHQEFRPGDFVMLSVSDNGSGMDQETVEKIFEPFFTTKGLGKGTGLGLATVYGIVTQNDGFINVCSEPGVGTTFKIFFPRQRAGTQGQETILLVEDVPDILTMTALMLEKFGYRVMAVPTPGEAIRVATEHGGKIHLLISDVIMPGMNGRALAQSISSISPGIKLLFMSGYTDDVLAHHGVLDEGVHFIQKPFSMQSLSEKVREALDSC